MSPEPDHTRLGALFAERYRPLQPETIDAQHDYAYGHLAEAMMRPFEQVAELIDPPDPYGPWDPLFFVDITPDWALQWLGQVVGVQVPNTATPDQARAMIKALSFNEVGKPETIINVIKAYLNGSQTVYFRERDGNAYRIEIITRADEQPLLEKTNVHPDPAFTTSYQSDNEPYENGWRVFPDVLLHENDPTWSASGQTSRHVHGMTTGSDISPLYYQHNMRWLDEGDPWGYGDGPPRQLGSVSVEPKSAYTARLKFRLNNDVPGRMIQIFFLWVDNNGNSFSTAGPSQPWNFKPFPYAGVYEIEQVIFTPDMPNLAAMYLEPQMKVGPADVAPGGAPPGTFSNFMVDVNWGGIDVRWANETWEVIDPGQPTQRYVTPDIVVPPLRTGSDPYWSWDTRYRKTNIVQNPRNELAAGLNMFDASSGGQPAASLIRTNDSLWYGANWTMRYRVTRNDGAIVYAGTDGAVSQGPNGRIDIDPTHYYAFYVRVYARGSGLAPDNAFFRAAWYKADNLAPATTAATDGPAKTDIEAGGGVPLFLIAKPPADAEFVALRVGFDMPAALKSIDIDISYFAVYDLGQVWDGPVGAATVDEDVPHYIDGTMEGNEWIGTPDASGTRTVESVLPSIYVGEPLIQGVLESVVPAGIKVVYRTMETWDYQQMTTENGTYAELAVTFDKYRDMTMNERT